MELSPEVLAEAIRLYDEGRCLAAYRLATSAGPLTALTATRDRLFAGRLAANLGAPRFAGATHLRALRQDPDDPSALYFGALALLTQRGPLDAWELLDRREPLLARAGAKPTADLLTLRGHILALWRDFDAAAPYLERARKTAPEDPWPHVVAAFTLELEDRYDEALSETRAALALRPFYRPAVQAEGHLLQLLGHDREAEGRMAAALERIESAPLAAEVANLRSELGDVAGAERALERFAALTPLREREVTRWLEGRLSDLAHLRGDRAASLAHAKSADTPFFQRVAANLEAHPDGRRRLLPVGFVRQHHLTCAPATLSALGAFWKSPVDHLEVAERICYDGTPAASERQWAVDNGFLAREFTVTWDAARALLDRGVPFTFTTTYTAAAHLQAVIGYDEARGTLLLRDPYARHHGEILAKEGLLEYRSTGPRGMAMVPSASAPLLEGLPLPESDLYDLLFELDRRLNAHDREAAEAALARLAERAPEHRLTALASRALASYDGDGVRILAAIERLLALFPDDVNFQLEKVYALRDLARRSERLDLLGTLAARPGADPVLRRTYAQELSGDAERLDERERILRSVTRVRREDAPAHHLLALLHEQRGARERALFLARVATSLDDKDEGLAMAYFNACRAAHRTDEALALLSRRVARWGARSSAPARTLFRALEALDLHADARVVLEKARAERPADGELLLFAADAALTTGDLALARTRLGEAQGHVAPGALLRTTARVARLSGDGERELETWRQLLEGEPLALDAHRETARLLAETRGKAAAREHLARQAARFPHHVPLAQLRVEWLKEDEPAQAEAILREILAAGPDDAWTWRELALLLRRERRLPEAYAAMEEARRLEPNSSSWHSIQGSLLLDDGKVEEAAAAFRRAVELSVDTGYAITELMRCRTDRAGRRAELAFVRGELARQATHGEGLHAYRRAALDALSPAELVEELRALLAARPDLSDAWIALAWQLAEAGKADEALDVARRATERFPFVPPAWLALAAAYRARGEDDAEIAAVSNALTIDPAFGPAARRLAEAYGRRNDLEAARRVLAEAARRGPFDVETHLALADVLDHLRERDAAIEAVRRALKFDPRADGAWSRLVAWSEDDAGRGEVLKAARELTVARAGDGRCWLVLARLLEDPEDDAERRAALERAITLEPRNVEAYDLLALHLARRGEFDEARAVLSPAVFGAKPPVELRGRAAWIASEEGDLEEASRRMREVLSDEPSYAWGWRELADWRLKQRDLLGAEEAATGLAAASPEDATAWGFKGEVRLRKNDRDGAREAFKKAVALDPAYRYGGLALVDLDLDSRRLEDAERTLRLLESHVPGPFVAARRIRLLAARGDRKGAQAAARDLFLDPSNEPWPVGEAARVLTEAGFTDVLDEALREASSSERFSGEAASLWARRFVERGRAREVLPALTAMRARGDVGIRATSALIEALGERKRPEDVKLLEELASREKDVAKDAILWGSMGYALVTAGRNEAVVKWMSDHGSRAGLSPWMLLNLSLAYRNLGRWEPAREVTRAALDLPADHTTPQHRIWRAVDLVFFEKRPGEVPALIAELDEDRLGAYDRFLLRLVNAIHPLGLAAGDPAERLRDARTQLSVAEGGFDSFRAHRPLRRIHALALREIAAAEGGLAWIGYAGARVREAFAAGGPTGSAKKAAATSDNKLPPWIWFILAYWLIRLLAGS